MRTSTRHTDGGLVLARRAIPGTHRHGVQRDGAGVALRHPAAVRFIIASPDTVTTRPNAELLAEVFPEVEVRGEIGEHTTLLSIDKARQLLGYDPQHSWRDEVQ